MQGAPWGGILADVVYKGSHMYFGGVLLTPSCVVPTQHSSIPGVRLYCGREMIPAPTTWSETERAEESPEKTLKSRPTQIRKHYSVQDQKIKFQRK